MKGYKRWDSKDKKIVVSRDITFDKVSMMKPTNSQHVESRQTNEASQWVKSDATPRTLDSSVLIEFSPKVTT